MTLMKPPLYSRKSYEGRLRFLFLFLRFFFFFAASFVASALIVSRFARQSLKHTNARFTRQKANITAASAFSFTCTCCTKENLNGKTDTVAEYALLRKEKGANMSVLKATVEFDCCAAMFKSSPSMNQRCKLIVNTRCWM